MPVDSPPIAAEKTISPGVAARMLLNSPLHLQLSPSTIVRYCQRGILKGEQTATHRWRVSQQSVLDLIQKAQKQLDRSGTPSPPDLWGAGVRREDPDEF